jgi:bis(5'-nucleosyl)-tetraphosphatase (symmetrical)
LATYAIGDIQGCATTFERLLARIRFDPGPRGDRLWIVGDLVNRGPGSLAALRRVQAIARASDRHAVVLGNHELHLLARAAGVARPKKRDTLDELLAAPDRDRLLAWLRERPLLHREGRLVLVHAGLHPSWAVDRAETLAREAEAAIRRPGREAILTSIARGGPRVWDEGLSGESRVQAIVAALTLLRTCRADGMMCLEFKGHPDDAPEGCLPWYAIPHRRSRDARVVFGHWAMHGVQVASHHVATDDGCVFGRSLAAVRLDDDTVFTEPYAG